MGGASRGDGAGDRPAAGGRAMGVPARIASLVMVALSAAWLLDGRLDIRYLDAGLFLHPVASRLMAGEGYDADVLLEIEQNYAYVLSDPVCRHQAQQDLALVRVALVELSFQGDDPDLAERRIASAEEAARQSIACSPSSPVPWTILAWLEHIRYADSPRLRTYLDRSFRNGPYNGWDLLRRMEIQLRLYPAVDATEKAQLRQALDWLIFKQLSESVGELYVGATPEQRAFLREVLSAAPEREQKRAAEFIRRAGEDIDLPLVEPLGSRPWQ